MGRLGQIAGLVLLIGGCGLAAWGAPYYMLDWGSVLVIAGCVLASTGLISLLLGTALVRLDALRRDMAFMRAASATEHLDTREPPPLQTGPEGRDPGLEQMAVSAAPLSGMPSLPGLAGIAAAGGLAVAAKSILGSVVDERAEPAGTADEAGTEDPMASFAGETASVADDIYQPMAEADRLGLDDLLERVSDGMSQPRPEEDVHDNVPDAEGKGGHSTDATPESPAIRGDDLFARIDEATRSLKDQSAWPPPSAAEGAAIMDEALDLADQTLRGDDIFADLRADLSTDLRADLGMLPSGAETVEDADLTRPLLRPASDAAHVGDNEGQVEAALTLEEDAELSGGPSGALTNEFADGSVDQGSQHGDVSGLADEAGTTDVETDEEAESQAGIDRNETDEPEATAEVSAAAAAPAPIPSDEGIVAAYTVGDSAFAMLADGRIRVTTPDEQHLFDSMDELKVFMAQRRSKIMPV